MYLLEVPTKSKFCLGTCFLTWYGGILGFWYFFFHWYYLYMRFYLVCLVRGIWFLMHNTWKSILPLSLCFLQATTNTSITKNILLSCFLFSLLYYCFFFFRIWPNKFKYWTSNQIYYTSILLNNFLCWLLSITFFSVSKLSTESKQYTTYA